MNYAKAQKDVLAKLTKNPKAVINCITSADKVIFLIDGDLALVFPEDLNYIDAEKIEATCSLQNMHLPIMNAENKLEPTENLIDSRGVLAREFKTQWHNGDSRSVYIQEQYLKNFELPVFYQDINRPKGPIAITEITQMEGEHLVGFVMPYLKKDDLTF